MILSEKRRKKVKNGKKELIKVIVKPTEDTQGFILNMTRSYIKAEIKYRFFMAISVLYHGYMESDTFYFEIIQKITGFLSQRKITYCSNIEQISFRSRTEYPRIITTRIKFITVCGIIFIRVI